MVNNSTNINKTIKIHQCTSTKHGQQFHQYQQNDKDPPVISTVTINNSTNINKTIESSISDGQQFQQNQPIYKRKFTTVMVIICPTISTKSNQCSKSDDQQFHQYQQNNRKFHQWWSTNDTNINKPEESINSDDQQFHQYQQNNKIHQYQSVMINNSTNINKTKESLKSDGQQFHQYQQNKRKFKQWWSTIPPISTKKRKFKQGWSTIPPISTKQKKV